MDKKTVSVMIPTYNEQENAIPIYEAVRGIFESELKEYNYEILFIDNKSKDNTREKILSVCERDKNVKAIFNVKNFGQFNSPYYGIIHTTGDCTIPLCADFQDPVEVIPRLVREWEKGYKIICAIKTSSKENRLMYALRTKYYQFIRKVSSVDLIENFTGFGLYDRSFVNILRSLDDPTPFYRGLVAELGFEQQKIEYTQAQRRAGKTSNNWKTLYDAAWLSFTGYTKILLRLPAILGAIFGGISVLAELVYLIVSLILGTCSATVALLIGLFIFASIQLGFLGAIGEYVLALNERSKKRPLVVEEKRINF